jgi:hypothetical protein
MESSCECGNEPWGSINCLEIRVATQMVASRVMVSSIEFYIYIYIYKESERPLLQGGTMLQPGSSRVRFPMR